MSPTKILVVFYSRTGRTEQLALAAAVGAVEERAIIRMRRLPDFEEWTPDAANRYLRKEYVPPTEADAAWADGIVLGTPAEAGQYANEWSAYLASMARLKAESKLVARVCGSVSSVWDPEVRKLGWVVAAMEAGQGVEAAKALGRRVVCQIEGR